MRVKGFGVLLLAICTAATPALARQNQTTPPSEPPDQPPASNEPAPDQQSAPDQQAPPQQQDPQNPDSAESAPPAQPAPNLPATLTVPAGALVSVRVNQWLSSDRNHVGDTFSAVLEQPIVVRGWVVARRGQTVLGRVDVAQKAGDGNGVSRLGLEITELTLVDGMQIPVSTQMQQAAPSRAYPGYPGSAERNVATVGTTTVLGTIVGATLGGRTGAAIGAGLGATAGIAAIMYTRGRPTSVAPETLLSFRLAAPVEISTDKGPVAFQPVAPGDYKDQDAYGNGNSPRRRGPGPGYPPPYYYYGSCGPWGCYPGPYFGPYLRWGVGVWGPGFRGYGRFR